MCIICYIVVIDIGVLDLKKNNFNHTMYDFISVTYHMIISYKCTYFIWVPTLTVIECNCCYCYGITHKHIKPNQHKFILNMYEPHTIIKSFSFYCFKLKFLLISYNYYVFIVLSLILKP